MNAPVPLSLDTPRRRLGAWLDMHLVDHGLVRLAYNNRFALGGGMYRSSQPSPSQLRRYRERIGLNTVINLRGPNTYGSYAFEREACEQLGIELVDFRLFSRSPPTADEIHRLRDLFARLRYPALMHCKSGADRAGIAAVLYRHLHLGHPLHQAQQELHWRYGHLRKSKTGVQDFMIATYLARNAREPIDFLRWIDTEYDPRALKAQFRESGWASLLVDHVLHRE